MWTAQDAVRLHDYISRNPNFLEELKGRMPKIETSTVEGTAMSGARHAGAEDLMRALEEMQSEQADEAKSAFVGTED